MFDERCHILPPHVVYKNHPLSPVDVKNTRARIFKKLPRNCKEATTFSRNLWDYIATMLDSMKSNALEDFFDPAVTSFKFSRRHEGNDDNMNSFIISRTADEVLVSSLHYLCGGLAYMQIVRDL
jgi:hypothetical protein